MFCKNCGKENIEGASFCAGCGNSLTTQNSMNVTNSNGTGILNNNSKLGIKSLITSKVYSFLVFILFVIAGVIDADEESAEIIILSMFLLLFLGTSFVGLILGIMGVVQKERKILFSALGIGISGATIFLAIIIMILA